MPLNKETKLNLSIGQLDLLQLLEIDSNTWSYITVGKLFLFTNDY